MLKCERKLPNIYDVSARPIEAISSFLVKRFFFSAKEVGTKRLLDFGESSIWAVIAKAAGM
jgi:hypothetical protein